jgi:hypothetical protein
LLVPNSFTTTSRSFQARQDLIVSSLLVAPPLSARFYRSRAPTTLPYFLTTTFPSSSHCLTCPSERSSLAPTIHSIQVSYGIAFSFWSPRAKQTSTAKTHSPHYASSSSQIWISVSDRGGTTPLVVDLPQSGVSSR